MYLLRACLSITLLELVVLAIGIPAQAADDSLGDPLPEGAIQRLGTLRLRYSGIGDLAYLPDGRALVATGRNLEVWDMSAGEKLETLSVGKSSIRRIQISRDGTKLLMLDGTDIAEYSFAEQAELHRFPSNQPGINWVAYSPDETRVLSTSRTIEPPTLKEFELATGKETFSIVDDEFAVFICVTYAHDGKSAFVGGGFGPSFAHYDLSTGAKLHHLELNNSVNDIALSSDGERLLLGCRINAVEFKIDGYEILNQFRGHHGHQATAVAYTKDPDRLLTGARDGSVRLWDRINNKVLLRWLPHPTRCSIIRVSPDGTKALSYGGGSVVESNLDTGRSTVSWQRHSQGVEAVAILPDGRRALSASADTTLRLWDITSGASSATIEGANRGAYALALAPDGRRAAAGCKDGKLREFTIPDGALIRELPGHLGYVRSVTYTPDGTRLISSGDDGRIRVWTPDSEEPVQTMKGHLGGVLSIAVSADGRRLLSGGRDGTVRLWDLASAQLVRTFEGHLRWVEAVCFAPTGNQAFSSGGDGRILTWNLETGTIEAEMVHGGWVRALVCSPDGKTICAGGEDKVTTCWNLATGEKQATLKGHQGHVLSLAITADGKRLVSGSEDATLLVWDLP